MKLAKARAEGMNLVAATVTVNMVIPGRLDSGRLRYHVHGENASLGMESDPFRAWVGLWVAASEDSTWWLLRNVSLVTVHIPQN